MSLVEVLLRLGCGLVAWMVVFTHCIWTATLRVAGCAQSGDELWRLLLGFVPFTLGFSLLLNVTSKLTDVHRILAWLAFPLLVLVPLALTAIWPTFVESTLGGGAICPDAAIRAWHAWWGPLQLVTLTVIAAAAARVWLGRRARV